MNKLTAFIKLDFFTIKPYFTFKSILIYAVIAVFLSITSINIFSAVGFGLMMGTMFIGYPFAIGEKSNMDALYATLSVNRKTVVIGRYAFTLILNLCIIILLTTLAAIGLFAVNPAGFITSLQTEFDFIIILVFCAFSILMQSIQLPVYFKLGYSKAKFLSVLPIAIILAGYFAFTAFFNVESAVSLFFIDLIGSGLLIPLSIMILIFIVLSSVCLSMRFYIKREF
ncbi:MAG: ABC-2 transporter permease [Treponema sp.]|nr:ABC-2 transporter permease [Treponema sp.]